MTDLPVSRPDRSLPDLRRRSDLRAQQPLPAVLQPALQEQRLRRLGERGLRRRGQAERRTTTPTPTRLPKSRGRAAACRYARWPNDGRRARENLWPAPAGGAGRRAAPHGVRGKAPAEAGVGHRHGRGIGAGQPEREQAALAAPDPDLRAEVGRELQRGRFHVALPARPGRARRRSSRQGGVRAQPRRDQDLRQDARRRHPIPRRRRRLPRPRARQVAHRLSRSCRTSRRR